MDNELDRLRARVAELEATLDDEEASHQETLKLWRDAKLRIAELEAARDERLARERRELVGKLYDIARRISPTRLRESIRDDIEELARQYELRGAKP